MSNATPVTAVIFDMDGVLTDSEPLINAAAVAMFRERGLQVQPADFPDLEAFLEAVVRMGRQRPL